MPKHYSTEREARRRIAPYVGGGTDVEVRQFLDDHGRRRFRPVLLIVTNAAMWCAVRAAHAGFLVDDGRG